MSWRNANAHRTQNAADRLDFGFRITFNGIPLPCGRGSVTARVIRAIFIDMGGGRSVLAPVLIDARNLPCDYRLHGALFSLTLMEFLSLSDAISRHVFDGDRIALEGFTHLIPFAAGHEIIRQGRSDLTLIRMTPDLIYDQMIGSGCAQEAGLFVGRQSRRRFAAPACATRWNTGGRSRWRSRNTATRRWRMPTRRALPECPARSSAAIVGSDLPAVNPHIRFVACPFTGESLACVPAHRPDVSDHPRAEGRPRGQRPDRGHRRGAEGGGAGRARGDRDGGGDGRRFRHRAAPTR